jgi:hypothetical protein
MGRLMFQEKAYLLVYGQRADQVIVIQNQHERPVCGSDIVDQGCEHSLWRGWLGGLHHGLGSLTDVGLHSLQSRHQVGEKAGRVAVTLVEG